MTAVPRQKVDLKKLLAGAQLPALPQIAIRLLELSRDEENGPAEFAVPIESDPGLAGQVLRFVNSSYFGFSREISNVKLAITLVGVRTIKNFALWSAVFSLMPNPRCGPFDLKSLWQDSLRRALFARDFAKILGMKEAEEPFSAALLQDMAVPLLAKEVPQVYMKLLEARGRGRVQLSQLERQVFGWTHAEAAGIICRQWNLPESFATLVENHLAMPPHLNTSGRSPNELAVALSSLLPVTADDGWVECAELERCYGEVVPPGAPSLVELLARIDSQFDEFAPLLKLSAPSQKLEQAYHEATAVVS
jgi:HD-like signal output (HDOD) protein